MFNSKTRTKEGSVKVNKAAVLWDYTKSILIALVLALFIRAFVIQAYKIPSGSMLDTLQIGDHILVEKFMYGTHIPFTDIVIFPIKSPKKGDIIVFSYPENHHLDFIKRVIGLPGDTVQGINKNVYVNDKKLKESYIKHIDGLILPSYASPRDNFGPIKIPKNHYFVMGDNRDNSKDGRFWGFVKREEIKGKALLVYFSWNGQHNKVRFKRLGKLIH